MNYRSMNTNLDHIFNSKISSYCYSKICLILFIVYNIHFIVDGHCTL